MHASLRRFLPRPPFSYARSAHTLPVAVAALLIAGVAGGAAPIGAAGSRPAPPGHAASHYAAIGTHRGTLSRAFGTPALSFEPNRGQAERGVAFLARGHGYRIGLTATGAVLTLSRAAASAPQAVVGMALIGGNRAAQGQGEHKLPGTVGYLSGRDAKKWLIGIPTYAAVRYAQVYPGVDLLYYGNQRSLEYDFRVAPGANPRQIRLAFSGVGAPAIAANGDLILRAAGGVVREHRPVIYQLVHGARRSVAGGYVLAGHTVAIRLGAYDRHIPLIVDPVLVYSSYYGGSGDDRGNGIALDGQGNIFVVGTTTSGRQAKTAFVSKLDPTGTQVLWTQYVNDQIVNGDSNRIACDSTGNGIAVDAQGNAYVTGMYGDVGSDSWDNNLCVDKAVLWLKIDPADKSPIVSFFGKYDTSNGNAIAVDGHGNSYVTGQTDQTEQNFPVTAGAFQTLPGIDKTPDGLAGDAFVLKVDPSGNVVYGTFLGGSYIDEGLGIAVDSQGSAWVVGATASGNFPITNNALQTQPGDLPAAGFVSELSPDGSTLAYSTFLSGNNGESVNGVAVDGQGYVYVVGSTSSDKFPTTPNAYKTTCGTDGICNATKTWYCDPSNNTCYWQIQAPEDVFLTKLDPRQSGPAALVYSTFLGGSNRDLGQAIAVDGHGNAYITGRTASVSNFPTLNASQSSLGGDWDAFVAKIDTTQSGAASLVYSTYLGGSGYDEGDAIAIDAAGNAYVSGYTSSTDFPTQSPAQPANNGGNSDAFIAKLGPQTPIVPNGLALSPSSVVGGQPATGTVTLNAPAPAGGATVILASGNPAAAVPAGVVVPAGATSATFTVSTQADGAPTAVTIAASYGGVSQTAALTVNPAPAPPTRVPPTQAPPTQAPPTQIPPATATPTHPAATAPAASPTPTSPPSPGSPGSGSQNGSPGSGSQPARNPGTQEPSHPVQGSPAGSTHHATLALVITGDPAQVANGGTLVVSGRTASRAWVSANVQISARRVSFTGKGKHRRQVVRTVVLYHVARQGRADGRGRFALRLRIAGVPHTLTRATLTIQARSGRVSATRSTWITVRAGPRAK